MKAYNDLMFKVGKRYIMVAIKNLVCSYIHRDCLYVSREFESVVPSNSVKIEVGKYLCTFKNDTEYVETLMKLMKTKSGFLIPESDFNALYSEYSGMFNIPDNSDQPMYLEAKSYFNDNSYVEGFNNTITIVVHNWNLTYNEVAYDVPPIRSERREPEYYAREMLDKLTSARYNSARAFTNSVDKMRQDAGNVTSSVDSVKEYCKAVIQNAIDSNLSICAYYIKYLDGTHSRCYARNFNDLYSQLKSDKIPIVGRIYFQMRVHRPLIPGETYLVTFRDGRKRRYDHENLDKMNSIFQKFLVKNEYFEIW